MKKSKSLFLTTIISLAMVFSMMFGIMPNNLKSVYASGGEIVAPQIISVGDVEVDQETNMGGAPTVTIGQPYSTQVLATGGELTYSAGAGEYMKLPKGLSINSETGLISGTCTETEIGRFNVYIEVSNNAGKAHAVVGMWVVDNSIVPVIETEAGQLGEVYVNSFASFQVTVSNEADLMNDLQWSVKDGSLPNGMNLNYAKTKTVYIQGEPTQSGTFEFTLRVENGVGSAERTFSIVVQEGIVQPRIIDYNELPYAIVGKPYEYQLRASGTNTQSNPIVWSYNDEEYSQTSYDLGNGLTLSNTGLISGTPTVAGQPYFNDIYAKNSAGSDHQSAYIIVHANGEVTSIVVSPAETVVEKGGSFQFAAEVFGYGDVSQTIESWDNSMYHQPSGGWFTRPTSEDTKVVNGLLTVGEDEEREQIMVVAVVGDVKGYAMVTIVKKGTATHSITFDSNEGTGSMSNLQYPNGYEYTLPTCTFTAPTGKQFKCWSVGGQEKAVGDTITLNEDVTIVAIWEDIPVPTSLTATYTGTIFAGTTINPGDISITLTYSDDSTEPVNAGNVEYWYNGQQITNPVAYVFGAELIGNLNITIKYEGLETTMAVQIVGHAITFNANGGTGEMTATEYVGAYTLPANEFTAPTGQQFKGWSLTNNGEVIGTATYNVTEPITLYAIWEDIPVVNYTISFNANNGTGTMQNVEYAGTYTLPTCTFTAPTGKQFKGWATSANGEAISGTTYNVTEDTELFAIWEDIPQTPTNPENPQPPVNPNEPQNPEQPKDTNNGLGVGAIIGIVLASLLVLGTGGFALVWFVIKKKSWADFVAIFKKK